jgi:hypothetical protein
MPELVQHVIVTLAALSAAGIIVRRVFGAIAPGRRSASPCDSCPSAARHGKLPHMPAESATPSAQPVILVKRGTRDAGANRVTSESVRSAARW